MKKLRAIVAGVVLILGLIIILHAQSTTSDSIVQLTAEAQGLSLVAPVDVPEDGTFWVINANGILSPYPGALFDPSYPVFQITSDEFLVDASGGQISTIAADSETVSAETALTNLATEVVNLISQVQTAAAPQPMTARMSLMAMDDSSSDSGPAYTFPTNGLWLEITNYDGNFAYLNLHNATNQVYAIWTTTNLLTSWNMETELWPTDTNCQPFTIENFDRQDLFVRAEDWTDVWTNGLPCWWVWEYFHTLGLTATNLDSQGNMLGYDYTNHLDPNVISFLATVTNTYVNTAYPVLQLSIYSGTPDYYAILANDTNTADAVWQPYTGSSVIATLGADGNYNVSVGLRGWPTNGTATWQSVSLVKDTVPPLLTLTSPTSGAISNSPLALAGYANEALSGLTFDVSNANGIFTNQQGSLTGQFYDTNLLAFTTNWFQCSADLSDGTNLITLHGTDWAGNTSCISYAFVYFNTNPPVLAIVWPSPNLAISGSNFTVQAQVDSTAAKISASITDSGGDTNTVQGFVEKNGLAWIQNLPLNIGTNLVTVTATGANGSMSVTNFNVIKNDVGLVIYPLESYQLNQSSVSVYGEIGDSSLCVWVNGVQATVNDDGTWEADGVPVSPVGTASLSVQVYVGDPVLVASQNYFQPQPVTVGMMSYSGRHDLGFYGSGTETINWSYNTGGNYYNQNYGNNTISTNKNGIAYIDFGGATFTFDMPWEYAAVTTPQFYGPWQYSYGNYTQTRVMVEPSGQAVAGTTNLYLVLANANEFSTSEMEYGPVNYIYGWDYFHLIKGIGSYFEILGLVYAGDTPLPPEWLQIQGQTLINAGIDSVSGMTIVAAPAGVNWDITPVATRVYQNQAYTFNVQAFDITPQMLVDMSRTGNANQLATPDNPYRFWINDAQEQGDISSADNDIPGSSTPNYALNQVNGRSDLINYFPVALSLSNVLQWLPLANGFEYHLAQADGAVKFVYTGLMPTNAFDYLTNLNSYGYGTNADEWVTNADTIQVLPTGATGTILDTNWLTVVQNNGGYGVVLMEGAAATTQPLMLEIWKSGQKLGGVPLYLSIDGVEKMYRQINLRSDGSTADPGVPPNYPDSLCDGKQIVFIHGYSVSGTDARGWNAEVFKRLYQTRSHAMFTGVDWAGDDGWQIPNWVPVFGGDIPNYYTNVASAFLTASNFQVAVSGLPGAQKYVMAHSLGNMVASSAIKDFGLSVNSYFALDAAVATEAYDGNGGTNTMVNPTQFQTSVGMSTGYGWADYDTRLWSTEWYRLFDSGDGRSNLTWRNRFGVIGNLYNFYSSGEDVLENSDGTVPDALSVTSTFELSWVLQEMNKGNGLFSISQAGWTTSTHWLIPVPGGKPTDQEPSPPWQTTTNYISNDDLRVHPFFSTFNDSNLMDSSAGSDEANIFGVRATVLAGGIPALSNPTGANEVSIFDSISQIHNFDLTSDGSDPSKPQFQTGWPQARLNNRNLGNRWLHSDFNNVAYPFIHELYETITKMEN